MSKRQQIIFHVIFWLFFYFKGELLNLIGTANYRFGWEKYQSVFVWTSILLTIFTTYLIRYILNRYFSAKQYLNLTLAFVVVSTIYISLRYTLEEVLLWKLVGYHNYSEESRKFPYYITDNMYNVIGYLFNAVFLKMIEDFFANEKEKNHPAYRKTKCRKCFSKESAQSAFFVQYPK